MDRREFLKRASFSAAGLALALTRGDGTLSAQAMAKPSVSSASSGVPDLVAVKGSTQANRLDRSLKELGGIEAFVKKGQTVAIKPNIGWSQDPRTGANTNPELVRRLAELCFAAGAKKVLVFDHTCDDEDSCYKNSLIGPYARQAGATMVPADRSGSYQEVAIAGAVSLKRTRLHEAILEADVFFNVPVLKEHGGIGISCAMKNLMGMVWDRGAFHAQGLEQCIVDSCLIRKPSLTIIDADRCMLSGGPRAHEGSRYGDQKMLLVSKDMVALEAVGAATLGMKASDFGYIALAAAQGIGSADLRKLDIRRLSV